MSNSFSENIRRFRKERDWSQESFAGEIASIFRDKKERSFAKSVSQWENGIYPPVETILAIAEVMEVTLDELFFKEIEDFKSNCYIPSKRFERLSNQEIEFLYNCISENLSIDKMGGEIEFFFTYAFIETTKKEKTLVVKVKELSKETEISNKGEIDERIEKWLQNSVLKNICKQGITFTGLHVLRTDDDLNMEKGVLAEIPLALNAEEIEKLFIEYAKRKAIDKIDQAREEDDNAELF